MLKIAHRINTARKLNATPGDLGIEIDIRPYGSKLVVHHDPFKDAIQFEDLLNSYQHSFLIANIKAEGIEKETIDIIEKAGIKDYFLLDVTIPFLVRMSSSGFEKMAIRVSEYEPLEYAMSFAGKVEWAWLDCFNGLAVSKDEFERLQQSFKVCLVSPELQNHPLSYISKFKQQSFIMTADAVCTKKPELW